MQEEGATDALCAGTEASVTHSAFWSRATSKRGKEEQGAKYSALMVTLSWCSEVRNSVCSKRVMPTSAELSSTRDEKTEA